ncbi:M1 family metallopeptidase [Catalinimonas niigatensis]|uniref:M1 family metallopeptidase n=1 Tax=Catalinimonas niigatensis TaxID=1397264 RepID=UPI002666E60C|nr:M1 family metallopeptidase [Catalinimonas niigatensis]WPP53438.1 M1 family metallopeptidase [Catalinimonas niigatensis]
MRYLLVFLTFSLCLGHSVHAQNNQHTDKFEQLGPAALPTPNVYRAGSGAPGHKYWQQRADYKIACELNDETQRLTGSETITYYNNSPDVLDYLWLQLDQNMRAKDSDTYKTQTNSIADRMNVDNLEAIIGYDFDGGHKIQAVKDAEGNDIPYKINRTMMRVDIAQPLQPGEQITFSVDWYYNVNDRLLMGGRGGHEYFPEDGNYLYTITQWFPRMAVYDDHNGWQHKQFLGRGEFALTFGNYEVAITVPSDHIVASTGTLQNPEEVLTQEQRDLLEKSKTADKPVIIVSQKEAEKKEKSKAKDKKTWVYKAEDVRDFAFGSSRKYIWDAMGVDFDGRTVMAMSYYPKEANPLYEQYSTEVVAHTLKTYSKYTIPYPYPKAISVEASNGMEYPMICFNYGRPNPDGTYSERIKYGMIGVIIHEVGHNFFPMIVNSDERQWTWMDEGLNTFVQYLTEQEWDRNYPSRRGPAFKIVPYMSGDKSQISPIMTNSEQVQQLGPNAYAKPATALNILRETVMGRELFDHAFKTYATRWAFKHPEPADFFRTMEDASGTDLDWFWRGWFFTTDHVDIGIDEVKYFQINTQDPRIEQPIARQQYEQEEKHISQMYNKEDVATTAIEADPSLRDFYNSYDPFAVAQEDVEAYNEFVARLDSEEKELLKSGMNFYEVTFNNAGGLVMPVILEWTYEDGSTEIERIPAEIWRYNAEEATKVFAKNKKVTQIHLDPYRETADINENNNFFPKRNVPTRFEIYKEEMNARGASGPNPMQKKKKNSDSIGGSN